MSKLTSRTSTRNYGDVARSSIASYREKRTLSVVVPAFNEEAVLEEFHARLVAVLDALALDSEIVYVNDGSTDATLSILENLRSKDARTGIVDLSRNFGKEIALTAGLDHSNGDAVVVIDADLQDPPEVIPQLVSEWKNGYDVVFAQRVSRAGETLIKRTTATVFYWIMQNLGPVSIPRDTGDFRLLSRRAVDALRTLRERHRFMKGLFTWIGYRQSAIRYHRDARFAGETKWNYWRLWNLSIEGMTSFTIAPLKVATYIGLLAASGAFIFGIMIILGTLLYGNEVAGYPSLMVIVLFLGGIQLTALGIIGEYLGRVFNETKQRPLYFVQQELTARVLDQRSERQADSRLGSRD